MAAKCKVSSPLNRTIRKWIKNQETGLFYSLLIKQLEMLMFKRFFLNESYLLNVALIVKYDSFCASCHAFLSWYFHIIGWHLFCIFSFFINFLMVYSRGRWALAFHIKNEHTLYIKIKYSCPILVYNLPKNTEILYQLITVVISYQTVFSNLKRINKLLNKYFATLLFGGLNSSKGI